MIPQRIKTIDPAFEALRVLDLTQSQGDALAGQFCVVEDGRFRIRDLIPE